MKTLHILISVFCLLLISCASSIKEADIQKAQSHYQLGISYLNDNNIQPAFVEFQKALEINPLDKETHNAIGVIYLAKLEDYPNAIKHFREALKLDENYSEAANNLGNAYAKTNELKKAVEAYKLALSNPQYSNAVMAFNNLGMVYYRLSRYDESVAAFKEAIKRFSNFHMSYYGLALCFNAMGRYGDAATALTRAIEQDPSYLGDKKKAEEDMKDKKLSAKGLEEKDITDYLEILKY